MSDIINILPPVKTIGSGVVVGTVGFLEKRISGSRFSPLSGASITIAGKSTISDEKGEFRLMNLPEGEYLMTSVMDGYFNNYKQVTLLNDETTDREGVFMLKAEKYSVFGINGGTVQSTGELGTVIFPPKSFITSGGEQVDIASYGVITTKIYDAESNPLEPGTGCTAEIKLKVLSPETAPLTSIKH